jgi:hypothetical protein
VTEAEARDLCVQLAREHPEGLKRQPMTPTIEGKPKPPQADDPRSAHQRNVPGAWG